MKRLPIVIYLIFSFMLIVMFYKFSKIEKKVDANSAIVARNTMQLEQTLEAILFNRSLVQEYINKGEVK